MKAVYFVLLCALLDQSETKCNTLLMCPSFCMKVKNGCYVCDCGMFSNYLHRASNEMAEASDRQTSQTGTKLSSFTSGYDTSVDVKGSPNVQNNQRLNDYSRMMRVGIQYMNIRPQPVVPHNVGMSAPNFINYGHSYQNMPGMNCIPVDETCPSSCWSTDVFTGCVHCSCTHVINVQKPAESSNETTSQRVPTAVTPFESQNLMNKHVQKTPTPLPRVITTFASRTGRTNEVPKSEPLSTKPLQQSNTYHILVPTKPPTSSSPLAPPTPRAPTTPRTPSTPRTPPTPRTPSTPRTPPTHRTPSTPRTPTTPRTPSNPRIPSTSRTPSELTSSALTGSSATTFQIDAERRISEVTGRRSTPRIDGYLIPTPLTNVKAFGSTFNPQFEWTLIETHYKTKDNSRIRPNMGVRTTSENLGYLTPTPLPKTGQFLHSDSSQKTDWKYTENEAIDLGQEIMPMTTQTKIRVQSPGDLTTISSIIDALREPTNNTDNNTRELRFRINQSTISSKLERPLNPLITVKTTGYQTMTNNTNSILIHQSLSDTEIGDYFSDIISNDTFAETNRVGFYVHSESG